MSTLDENQIFDFVSKFLAFSQNSKNTHNMFQALDILLNTPHVQAYSSVVHDMYHVVEVDKSVINRVKHARD